METLSQAAYTLLRNVLREDFSEDLSEQIILQNTRKCFIDFNSCNSVDYVRLVDAIMDDYEMINPLGDNNFFLKKNEIISAL
jgi:hypothetical protein